MKKLFARLLFIPLTVIFLNHTLWIIERFLTANIYFCAQTLQSLPFESHPASLILFAFFVFWIAALLVLEILAHFKKDFNLSYWLKHLRYAPIATLFFANFIVIFFDAGMIEFSKWRIRNYVYGNSDFVHKPELDLHNDYRGWCGNGYFWRRSNLYFDVASEGLTDENPHVRARALLITREVADTLVNGTDGSRFNEVLRKGCLDSDSIVRQAAQMALYTGETDCERFLLPADDKAKKKVEFFRNSFYNLNSYEKFVSTKTH